MEKAINLRGLTTISYWADDLKAAKIWHAKILGVEPYFERPDPANPAYIEFSIGDYQHELGIVDRKFAPPMPAQPGGEIAYWHVNNFEEPYCSWCSAIWPYNRIWGRICYGLCN